MTLLPGLSGWSAGAQKLTHRPVPSSRSDARCPYRCGSIDQMHWLRISNASHSLPACSRTLLAN